jgi:hypothetical protein
MATKVKGDKIKEGSIQFNALAKDIARDIPVVVGNCDEEQRNRFKYVIDNVYGTVYCIMYFGDMIIIGQITDTFSGRHLITGVVISSSTNEFKEGDGIRIGGGMGEFLTPLYERCAEVTSCGLTYENTTSINPTVWKYLCNPFLIDVNNTTNIPEDLLRIIFNYDEYDAGLHPITPNVIKCVCGDDIFIIHYVAYGEMKADLGSVRYNISVNEEDGTLTINHEEIP